MLLPSMSWSLHYVFTMMKKSVAHLKDGATMVTTSALYVDASLFGMGVNHERDNNSSLSVMPPVPHTTQQPPVPSQGHLCKQFSIKGLMTTVHATTVTQKSLVAPNPRKLWCNDHGLPKAPFPHSWCF